MIKRQIRQQINDTLQHIAAVVLLGPRQVGKTTLAHEVVEKFDSVYLDLEEPGDVLKLDDPSFYFEQNREKLIITDEVQRMPDLFQVLRSQIDRNRRAGHRNGQFLLLGSASNELLNQSSESLAGRVSYLELHPLNVQEVGADRLNDLWLCGGFPDSFLVPDFSFQWRQNFIRTYLERDIPMLGSRVPAETLRRFWTMLAHNQGQMFNASRIGGSLGVSGQTTSRYLDLLVDLMLVRRLQPWYANVGKRLVKSPKTYIRDCGILHTLLNIQTLDDLLSHPVLGSSWEGLVIENLLSVAPPGTQAFFYRTAAGAEIDLVLNFGGKLWAIEVKRTTVPRLTKGFYHACDDIKPTAKWVVYAGDEEYKLRDGITVLPLARMMELLSDLHS
ncbi:MAG: ATP-binding protein [Robiginitomaculum sp.]|nr:ATP-binding protein [Robiginitomaculum sp.]